MLLNLLLATAAAIGGSSNVAGQTAVHRIFSVTPRMTSLYDQNGNDIGNYVFSEHFFDSSLDAYDSQAADDFVVPSGHLWNVKEIDVTGTYFFGSGQVTSVHVFFYNDQAGLPGSPNADCNNLGPSEANGSGSFVVKIPKTCKVKLRHGTHWLSVQVNDSASRQWGWEGTSTQNGNPFAWRNPGDALGTGCTTWRTDCFATEFDLMFALKGKDVIR
ncbi:MAG TPA: hypothetical protein VLC74_11360 [Rhizomicrobium sp.]|nr:hypothetical protein [Rhizomicrobium sp.]